MVKKSLRIRQLILALIATSIILVISFIGFTILFENHIQRRFSEELQSYADMISSTLFIGEDQQFIFDPSQLPQQFNEPLSGFYWRITNIETGHILRSRSLWDKDLPASEENKKQKDFFILFQEVTLSIKKNKKALIEVAIDASKLTKARNEFAQELGIYILLLGLVLIVLMWLQIEIGLSPLRNMKQKVEVLLNDPSKQLSHNIYREVEPLTKALNHLLDVQALSIEKAEQRTADMAHGLKSPLAALRNQAQKLERQGDAETAQNLRLIGQGLERQVERELVKTRAEIAASRKKSKCNIYVLCEQLIRVLSSTAHGERIQWNLKIPKDYILPFDKMDMAEALGPILENASHYAKSTVSISPGTKGELYIDDDGEGMSQHQRETAIQRGVRFDERSSSTGLGLSIAYEILISYGWTLELEESSLSHGLRVTIAPIDDKKLSKE